MQSLKCSNCNLVNFATVENCKRCGNDLTVLLEPQPIAQPIVYQPHPSGFKCPFCQSDKGFYIKKKTSGAGCAVSIVLLIIFFPLCWLGLLMQNEERFCVNCNMKLG